jgi:hypothetical protein
MHAMWNASGVPGRIIEIITPGGFESYFRELATLLAADASEPGAFAELAAKYGLTYGHPDWLDDIVERYRLTPADPLTSNETRASGSWVQERPHEAPK